MILISGFEPFKGYTVNPSQLLVDSLEINDSIKVTLPVEYQKSFEILRNKIDQYHPELILMFGLAQSRNKISLERYAYNQNHCSIPDNGGNLLSNSPIIEHANDRLESNIPLTENELWDLSEDPGRYVCNDLYYRTLDYCLPLKIKTLFIHLPATKEMDSQYTINAEQLKRDVQIILNIIRR